MNTQVEEFEMEYISMEELVQESVELVQLVVDELLVNICVQARIKKLPRVVVTRNESESAFGAYMAGASIIRLNAISLQGKGIEKIAYALAHEVWHHRQWEDGERFEHYVTAASSKEAYEAQRVEAEANAFAGKLFPQN